MATVDEAAAGAAATFWVEQAGIQVAALTEAAANQAAGLWAGFSDWYTPAAIAVQAAAAAEVSRTAQDAVTQVMAQYIAEMTAVLADTRGVTIPRLGETVIRNGADPVLVHSRAAKAYRIDYAKTQDDSDAIAAAMAREMGLIEADLMLAARQAQVDAMRQLDDKVDGLELTHYRRVLRPELSMSGSCGLCLAASLNVYTTGELLPIHNLCKCLTMPIIGGNDPAKGMNQADREAAYAEAGATGKSELSNIRVQVHEHGELGPVLTVKGQKFTGPGDLNDKGSKGGSGGGKRPPGTAGGEPPEDDGSRRLPVDESVVFTGRAVRAPGLNKVLSYADLDERGRIAPDSDPHTFFSAEEQAIADWLSGRGIGPIRSVEDLKEPPRTPDAVFDAYGITCEFKTLLESDRSESISQAIRSARGQSRRIVIDGRPQNLGAATAADGIRRALGKYAEDLDEVIVILGDGTSVGWWHGRR